MNIYYLMFVSAMLLYGTNGTVAHFITLNSYEIVLCRAALGGLFLFLVLLVKRQPFVFKGLEKSWAFLAASSVTMGFGWLFLFEAFAQIGVSLAILLNYLGPIFVMMAAPILFHEHITRVKILGLASVVIGMVLVNGADVQAHGVSWGLFCGLMSGITYGSNLILAKKAVGIPGMQNAACQLAGAFVIIAIFTAIFHTGTIQLDGTNIAAILVLGVVNSGLACCFCFTSMQHLPAQSISICSYIEPLSALAFAALFLGEVLTPIQWAGAAFILGGIMGAELWERKS